MDSNDFDSVSWRNEPENEPSRPPISRAGESGGHDSRPGANGKRRVSSASLQAGHHADAVDLAGVGDGRLECTVDSPQKESDGTKDAYVSYLVTIHVRPFLDPSSFISKYGRLT